VARRRDERDLVSGGAVGSARELAGVGATMAARCLRFAAERGREREWRQPRRVVAVLKAPWADRWGQDRRTVATACPRVGEALWPVDHAPPLTKLNRGERCHRARLTEGFRRFIARDRC
jgi:hypothetical protein